MKKINKEESTKWFENWKQQFAATNHKEGHYEGDFSTDDPAGSNRRRKLRRELIEEQGGICCYCMNRISLSSSHIEHFWPKKHFPDKDMDYQNLFASCNGEGSIILDDEHCGHKKEDWWRNDMIPPTDPEVEKVFRYSMDGRIHGVRGRESFNIAQEMIQNMGLDSYHLQRNRRSAIEASEVFDESDYSEEEIRSFIDYYSNKDNGSYIPYCKAIVDCLREML